MKKNLLFCLLIHFMYSTYCQTEQSSYEQYKEYALGGYLNTIFSNVCVAGVEWQNGDTTSAIKHINEAIKQGLFDSSMIIGNSSLKGFTELSEWRSIKKILKRTLAVSTNPDN